MKKRSRAVQGRRVEAARKLASELTQFLDIFDAGEAAEIGRVFKSVSNPKLDQKLIEIFTSPDYIDEVKSQLNIPNALVELEGEPLSATEPEPSPEMDFLREEAEDTAHDLVRRLLLLFGGDKLEALKAIILFEESDYEPRAVHQQSNLESVDR